MLTQQRHDADWDKADEQLGFKKKLAELKKTHGHLSLPRLHHITMQRKKGVKVEHIRVVSLKSSINCVNNYGLRNILSLTQHRHDADWDENKILKIKACRTEEDPWLPKPAKTPSRHHAAKEEGQGGAMSLKLGLSLLYLNSRNVNNYDLHNYSLSFLITQHRHDGDWDKADQQDFEKKKKKAGRTEEDP